MHYGPPRDACTECFVNRTLQWKTAQSPCMASLSKAFTILKHKSSFYRVQSSYVLLRKQKLEENQALFRVSSAHSSSGLTQKFPGHRSKSRQHLRWSSTRQEIYSISGFHKMVICRIQFQLSTALGTKPQDIPVTQSHYVSTATCSRVIKWPQVPERITLCITLQTSAHLIIDLFTLWFSIPLLMPLQLSARPHCRNATLTSLGSGGVTATKASSSPGAGVKSRGRSSLSNLQHKHGASWQHTFIYQETVKRSVIVLLATGNCSEDVSFYTEAVTRKLAWKNRLGQLQTWLKHWSTWDTLSQFTPDWGLKRTQANRSGDGYDPHNQEITLCVAQDSGPARTDAGLVRTRKIIHLRLKLKKGDVAYIKLTLQIRDGTITGYSCKNNFDWHITSRNYCLEPTQSMQCAINC